MPFPMFILILEFIYYLPGVWANYLFTYIYSIIIVFWPVLVQCVHIQWWATLKRAPLWKYGALEVQNVVKMMTDVLT